MNQMRAMKIGLEQRTQMKVDTRWKVVEWGSNAHQPLPCLTRQKDVVCEADGKEHQQGFR